MLTFFAIIALVSVPYAIDVYFNTPCDSQPRHKD